MQTVSLADSFPIDTFDCLPQGIIILSNEFNVMYWNLMMEEWTGIPRDQIIGNDITEVYPHLASSRYTGRMKPLFHGGPPVLFSSHLHHHFVPALLPNGKLRIQQTTVSTLEINAELYALVSIHDVSDLTFLAQKTRSQHAQALNDLEKMIMTKEALRIDEARLESLLTIAQLGPMPTANLLERVLDEGVRLTQSKLGFIFQYLDENGSLEPICWTKDAEGAHRLVDFLRCSEQNTSSILYDVIHLGQPIIVNDLESYHAKRFGLANEDQNIASLLCVPVLVDNKIVALVGVVGKETPYDESDTRQLKLLLDTAWKIKMQREAENQRNDALILVRNLLDSSPFGIQVFDASSGQCVLSNMAASNIVGGPLQALQEQNFRELDSWKSSTLLDIAEKVISDGNPLTIETVLNTSFGKEVPVKYQLSRFVANDCINLLVIGQDMSEEIRLSKERKQIEEQLLHAQKMESLGVLAGGVAHDFNNILMSILGNTELAQRKLPADSKVNDHLARIETSAKRASDLANQMLTYSGKGMFVIKPVNINSIVTEIINLIEVSISKKIKLELNLAPEPIIADADETQMRQLVMNLVINAAEAIDKDAGIITISTGHTHCSANDFKKTMLPNNLKRGTVNFISVTDTGCGMDRNTKLRIFDPFFTTKFAGRGLGMAAVLGIIRSHKGTISVDSQPGEGSIFTILLPLSQTQSVSLAKPGPSNHDHGTGLVLLVDDEKAIRLIGREILNSLGYQCLTAEDGSKAVEIFKKNPDITCVILDLTMPGEDGIQVYEKLKGICPDVKVILSSGFTEFEVSQHLQGHNFSGFLQKPYTISVLNEVMNDLK